MFLVDARSSTNNHSGVTLGAQAGDGFIPTFCAIVFHQLFEGLGLGARIAGLRWPHGGGWKKWLMCIVYSLITPVGIAIVSNNALSC